MTVNWPPGLPKGLGENFTDGISRWSGLAVSSSTGTELLFCDGGLTVTATEFALVEPSSLCAVTSNRMLRFASAASIV